MLTLKLRIFPITRDRRWLFAAVIALSISWFFIKSFVSIKTGVPPDIIYAADNPLVNLNFVARLLTAVKIQLFSIAKLVWPIHLTTIYPGSSLSPIENPLSWWGIVVLAFIIFLSAALCRGWLKRSIFSLGILFYLVTFLTKCTVFVFIAVFMAERFAYLPSAGFLLALASLVPAAVKIFKHRKAREAFRQAMLLKPDSTIYRLNFEKSSKELKSLDDNR